MLSSGRRLTVGRTADRAPLRQPLNAASAIIITSPSTGVAVPSGAVHRGECSLPDHFSCAAARRRERRPSSSERRFSLTAVRSVGRSPRDFVSRIRDQHFACARSHFCRSIAFLLSALTFCENAARLNFKIFKDLKFVFLWLIIGYKACLVDA